MTSEWKPTPGTERIVCAAIRFGEHIICGARHFDTIMRMQIKTSSVDWYIDRSKIEQGFIDQYGQFYSRTEAWKIALHQFQIRRRCGGDETNGGTLFSENLY